ncbi:DUF389 domain-containing protein [Lentisphaera profundi]|uniref:DUF389 domain-containing protein n=1 Tax=Lentisphaera profundi TaxID=1658616 RepID=A0ABY7VYL2_9BACT|nr:DUF389 domain-containing protein [Lentisphaera profundi]WDE98363.1 DUF389 domain-containing protein [Lentisphaera profundi]
MSAAVVVENTEEVKPLIALSYQMAHAEGQDLIIIVIRRIKQDETSVDEINLAEYEGKAGVLGQVCERIAREQRRILTHAASPNENFTEVPEAEFIPKISCLQISGERYTKVVMKLLSSNKCGQLFLAKRAIGSTEHYTDKLFKLAPCSTTIVRPGKADVGRIQKILIPCSGGPHALDALKHSYSLVKSQGTHVHPLIVKPPSSQVDIMEEVGIYQLDKMLKSIGLELDGHYLKGCVAHNKDVLKGIAETAEDGYDFVVVGISSGGSLQKTLFGDMAAKLIETNKDISVAAHRVAKDRFERFKDRFEYYCNLAVPQLTREGRIALHEGLLMNSTWNFDFISLMLLSTSIAALGLISNSVAVVIGAMLVAPLMTPILAAGLALVQGNIPMIINASRSILFGFLASLGISFLIGLFTPMEHLTSEILSRGTPRMADLFIAFVSGIAAAHCMTRTHLSAALPGVAIASALVPPIASIGIALSKGISATVQGATVLFITNVICIVLGSALTFYAAGIRARPDQSKNRVVKRLYLILIFCMTLLCIPLSSRLVKYGVKKFSDSSLPNREEFIQMTQPTLDKYNIPKVSKISYKNLGDNKLSVWVWVQVGHVPDRAILDDMEAILSKNLKREVSVSIWPEFVMSNHEVDD